MESIVNGRMFSTRYFPIITGDIPSALQYGLTERNAGCLRSELHRSRCLCCRAWSLAAIQASKPFTQSQYGACHGMSSPMLLTPGVEVSACSSSSYNEYAKPKEEKKARQNRPQCSVCDKTFARASTLKIHMRIHRGEKPYKCTYCAKAFIQSANLVAHLRVHTGEKPYQCYICRKRFSQSSSVKTHIRIHTGERPFCCDHCGKSFSDRSTLSKHRRVHQKTAMVN